jgi:hypothetical protein
MAATEKNPRTWSQLADNQIAEFKAASASQSRANAALTPESISWRIRNLEKLARELAKELDRHKAGS